MKPLRSHGRSNGAGSVGVAVLARLITGAGAVSAVSGTAAWLTVRSQLFRERIVVPQSATTLAGRTVTGPLSALAEAEAIRRAALVATEGRTYSELGQDDPAAQMAMNASLLRSSLMSSVLAFGLASTQIAVGAVLMAIGTALSRLSGARTAARPTIRT
jgi:hypothetical protein